MLLFKCEVATIIALPVNTLVIRAKISGISLNELMMMLPGQQIK